jgi:hypothetical protein
VIQVVVEDNISNRECLVSDRDLNFIMKCSGQPSDRWFTLDAFMKQSTVSRSRILTIVVGGIAFWGPELLLNYVNRREPDWRVISVLLPASLLFAQYSFSRLMNVKNSALYMLGGVFLLGPVLMTVGTVLRTGHMPLKSAYDVAWIALFGVIPPYTFMMSAYDGSLLALLMAIGCMVVVHFRNKIQPGA